MKFVAAIALLSLGAVNALDLTEDNYVSATAGMLLND